VRIESLSEPFYAHADDIRTTFSNMKGKLTSTKTTEKIIEMVREYPVIYDQSSTTYRDADVTGNIWSSIAKALEGDVSGIYIHFFIHKHYQKLLVSFYRLVKVIN